MKIHKKKGDERVTLKERRLAANLTQEDVAKMLEVNQGSVSKWEGGHGVPLKKYRRKLASLFGCTEQELMEEH